MGGSVWFTRFANGVAHAAGRPVAFVLCCLAIVVWASSGPLFGFSDTWQLVINTGTTIVTFLMVFLIQNTQNRDGAAIQAKLDELIRVSEARNRFIGIEHLTDEEVEALRGRCEREALDQIRQEENAARHDCSALTAIAEAREKP
jgi:low affinity Fe/Cu permease